MKPLCKVLEELTFFELRVGRCYEEVLEIKCSQYLHKFITDLDRKAGATP